MSNKENEAPTGEVRDDSYVSGNGDNGEDGQPVPVVPDETKVEEDPIDDANADSDEQLDRDEKDAIDTSNIINERTRGAKPVASYREPGDEEGLPDDDDGTSSTDKA